jgi:transposase
MSHWLTEELLKEGLPVKCIDARHCAAFLSMKINKTDRNDAYGIAEVMRCNVYREVALKSRPIRELSSVLTCRKQLVNQRTTLLMSVRGILKPFGIKLGTIQKSEEGLRRIEEKIASLEKNIRLAVKSLLDVVRLVMEEIQKLEKKLNEVVKTEPRVKLLMTIPGVGPITALKYLIEIGDPERFEKSRSVGAYVGLTPTQYSSGETHKQGRISKCGSKELRTLLVEAAIVMLTRTKSWSHLKNWGLKLQKRCGLKKAATAVARKLSVVMLCMIKKNKKFIFGAESSRLVA